ncbi:MAG: zf-HC2 domain-containing protein [Clostridiales bacterium]|nr:zf-HC2 domain-containing protein [Clostridiales bacterium]
MKLKCYIVEDLLPTNIENLTSQETQTDIEEHLKECSSCRKLFLDMNQEIIKQETEKSESLSNTNNKKDLIYLDKIRKSYNKKSVLSLSFFVCITLLLLIITWNTIESIHYSVLLSYGILPIFISAGAILFHKTPSASPYTKRDFLIGQVLLFVFAALSMGIMYRTDYWIQKNSYPFGLADYEIGPFVADILYLSVAVAALCFIYGSIQILRKSYTYYFLCSHALTLIFMNIGFYRLLKTLSDISLFKLLRIQNLGIYIWGIIISIVIWLISCSKHNSFDNI